MKQTNEEPALTEEPSPVVLGELDVRPLQPEELPRATALLEDEHYLGAARPVGRTLTQVIHHQGRWVALVEWGPAALKLNDRDQWIGWTDCQRVERLELIAQNRRFLVLSATRMPNLASRALALATKALPEHWRQAHGFAPLLAETFTDIEQFEGTCYKAAGWQPCGHTQGFQRHRADFYQAHGRPKKLWLKPLQNNTRPLLCALDLPTAYEPALARRSAERPLPLKAAQIESLQDALRQVPDPRAHNRTFSCSSLLCLVALGLLAGRQHLAQIQRFGQFLTQAQRARLGWPYKNGTKFRKAPSYNALYRLLIQLNPHALAATLSQWLQVHEGILPRALAIDGKYVRDRVLTLCLSEHETGAPVALALADPAPRTEDNKKEGELTAARRLYPTTQLHGAIVTADALHCEQQTARQIVEQGGDYLPNSKAINPRPWPMPKTWPPATPPFEHESCEPGHGRLDQRRVLVHALEPTAIDLPHVRSLIVVEKTSSANQRPDEVTTSYYLSSRPPGSAKVFGQLVRGHWGGCEIRNHWVRDALWAEDRTRSKNWNLNANLAVLRASLIALRQRAPDDLSWPAYFEIASRYPNIPFKLITSSSFK